MQKGWYGGSGQVSKLGPDTMMLLDLAVESSWLELGGLFLASFARMGLERSCGNVGPPISDSEVLFSVCSGNYWPRTVSIESVLESGYCLSPKSPQDDCNGTFAKLGAEIVL